MDRMMSSLLINSQTSLCSSCKLPKSAASDRDSELVATKLELENVLKEHRRMKEELEQLQSASHEMQEGILSEFAVLRQQKALLEKRNNDLQEEITLAHYVRHESTISSLASAGDLQLAIKAKEALEAKAIDIENKYNNQAVELSTLQNKYNVLEDNYQQCCSRNIKLEGKVNSLEDSLKGLDRAEAGMSQAIQAKILVEKHATRLESELQSAIGTIKNLESKLKTLQSEILTLRDEKKSLELKTDIFIRERLVLEAELHATQKEINVLRTDKSRIEQTNQDLYRINENKTHEIESLMSERQDMHEFVNVLRQQMEDLQHQNDIRSQSNNNEDNDELLTILADYEDRLRLNQQEAIDQQQRQQELYDEITKLQSENELLSQMNTNLQHQLNRGN